MPVKPAPRWMRRLWRNGITAMTLPGAIYVSPVALTADRERLADLISHELVHVRQWRELGTVGFIRRYLVEYVRGRRRGLSHGEAYLAISLEREARQIAGY